MRKLLGCLILGLGMFASSGHADVTKLYLGGGVADGNLERSNNTDWSLGSANLTLGLQVYDFIGVEFEVGVASDDSGSILTDSLLSYQAAMLRVGYRWGRFGAYLLGGQSRIETDIDARVSDTVNAVGMGINLFGNDTTALNMHVLRLDDGVFTAATIGFQHYFGGYK